DAVDDAVNELLDARLALRRPDVPAEVLGHHDVGRELAPELGDLDVLLLEDGLAGLGGDGRRPELPLDLVVGMDAGLGELAVPVEALDGGAVRVHPLEACAPRPAQLALDLRGPLRPARAPRRGLHTRALADRPRALAGRPRVVLRHDRDRCGRPSGHRPRLLITRFAGFGA